MKKAEFAGVNEYFCKMELFYTNNIIQEGEALLNEEESRHCVKVLRHKRGDLINFVDGAGGLYTAEILSDKEKEIRLRVTEHNPEYERRGYYLHIAVAPTKNIERYEWFIEKAVELGIDEITPIIGEHSERKVFKRDRCERIILSAMKQSLKARLPKLNDVVTVAQFIRKYSIANDYPLSGDSEMGSQIVDASSVKCASESMLGCIRLFGHCREGEKRQFIDIISEIKDANPHIVMMIGPEGDFSISEIASAVENGFTAVQMGESRMRVETAALTAVSGIYLFSENFHQSAFPK